MPQLTRSSGIWRLLHRRLQPELAPQVTRTALILAPHQDDETLGCGGTILLKRNAGTRVHVAFMTDGSTSHRQFMAAAELCRRRRAEAIEACEVLGVTPDDLRFFDFPDGELAHHHDAAVAMVVALIDACRPHEMFVPYQRDVTSDHEATFRIATEALRKSSQQVQLYEYPVWTWNRWPWVRLSAPISRDGLRAVIQACAGGLGLSHLRRFRSGVRIDGVVGRKREALRRHRTQMAAVIPEVPWPTLGDVSNGDFVDCFFQDYEVFRCRSLPAEMSTNESRSL